MRAHLCGGTIHAMPPCGQPKHIRHGCTECNDDCELDRTARELAQHSAPSPTPLGLAAARLGVRLEGGDLLELLPTTRTQ